MCVVEFGTALEWFVQLPWLQTCSRYSCRFWSKGEQPVLMRSSNRECMCGFPFWWVCGANCLHCHIVFFCIGVDWWGRQTCKDAPAICIYVWCELTPLFSFLSWIVGTPVRALRMCATRLALVQSHYDVVATLIVCRSHAGSSGFRSGSLWLSVLMSPCIDLLSLLFWPSHRSEFAKATWSRTYPCDPRKCWKWNDQRLFPTRLCGVVGCHVGRRQWDVLCFIRSWSLRSVIMSRGTVVWTGIAVEVAITIEKQQVIRKLKTTSTPAQIGREHVDFPFGKLW